MIVSHGAGDIAEEFSKTFGVFAPTHEVIMLFPQAKMNWDEGATGPLFNTKNGIQPLFFK
jgi:hypothetical protein